MFCFLRIGNVTRDDGVILSEGRDFDHYGNLKCITTEMLTPKNIFSSLSINLTREKIIRNNPIKARNQSFLTELDIIAEHIRIVISENRFEFDKITYFYTWIEKYVLSAKSSIRDQVILDCLATSLDDFFSTNRYASSGFRTKHTSNLIEYVNEQSSKFERVLILDIKQFFLSISHSVLLNMLNPIVDSPTSQLLKSFFFELNQASKVFENEEKSYSHKEDIGLPIGLEISYVLANGLLQNHIDTVLQKRFPNINFARYIDDIIIFADSEQKLKFIKTTLENELQQIGLEINLNKSIERQTSQGFTYLRHQF